MIACPAIYVVVRQLGRFQLWECRTTVLPSSGTLILINVIGGVSDLPDPAIGQRHVAHWFRVASVE